MKIVLKKVPKLAIYFYLVGFIILLSALFLFFYQVSLFGQNILEPFRLQQLFIAGAIIVAIGSVINAVYQFKLFKFK